MIRNLQLVVCLPMSSAIIAGCGLDRSSMHMTLTPEKPVFRSDEPIRLKATIHADKGPVALPAYQLDIKVVPMEGQDRALDSTEHRAYCGTGVAEATLFYPVFFVVFVGDVGDRFERYRCYSKGESRTEHLVIARAITPTDLKPGFTNIAANHTRWVAGSYRVHVATDDSATVGGMFPPPLFWFPYKHPLRAEAVVRVE